MRAGRRPRMKLPGENEVSWLCVGRDCCTARQSSASNNALWLSDLSKAVPRNDLPDDPWTDGENLRDWDAAM